MELNEICFKAHEMAVDKGFWPTWNTREPELREATAIGLIHTEVSELMEAHRAVIVDREEHELGMAEEMADVIIRVCDVAGHFGIDLDTAVAEKMAYNATRPAKHGKRY